MNSYIRPGKTGAAMQVMTAHQAVQKSPSLGHLATLVKESSARLSAIESLIPQALRPSVKAGPIDGGSWCLLVSGSAAAAKIRQLLPVMLKRLAEKDLKVTSIRLKILMAHRDSWR